MGILADIVNIPDSCGGSEAPLLGGNVGCFIEEGNTDGVGIVKKGTRWAATDDLTEAFWKEQIQKGLVMPLPAGYEVTFNPSEDSYTTSNTGVKALDVLGLPEFEIKYKRDINFDVALARLQSFGAYEIVFFDDKNILGVASYGTDGYGGYTCGHLTPGMSGIKTPGNVKTKSLMFQLTDRDQFDKDRRQIVFANHGINFKKHTGISPFIVSFPSAISAGAAVQFKVTLADGSAASGLAATDVKAIVNGTDVVMSTATEVGTTGVYNGVLASALVAADELVVSTWNSTLAVPNIVFGAFIHRGVSDTEVVV